MNFLEAALTLAAACVIVILFVDDIVEGQW
jgi:hypothetical protein